MSGTVHDPYCDPRLADFSYSELEIELRQRALTRVAKSAGMKELLELRMVDGVPRRPIAWNDQRRWVLAHAYGNRIPQRMIATYLCLAKSTVRLQIARFIEAWDGPRRKARPGYEFVQAVNAEHRYSMRNEGRFAA